MEDVKALPIVTQRMVDAYRELVRRGLVEYLQQSEYRIAVDANEHLRKLRGDDAIDFLDMVLGDLLSDENENRAPIDAKRSKPSRGKKSAYVLRDREQIELFEERCRLLESGNYTVKGPVPYLAQEPDEKKGERLSDEKVAAIAQRKIAASKKSTFESIAQYFNFERHSRKRKEGKNMSPDVNLPVDEQLRKREEKQRTHSTKAAIACAFFTFDIPTLWYTVRSYVETQAYQRNMKQTAEDTYGAIRQMFERELEGNQFGLYVEYEFYHVPELCTPVPCSPEQLGPVSVGNPTSFIHDLSEKFIHAIDAGEKLYGVRPTHGYMEVTAKSKSGDMLLANNFSLPNIGEVPNVSVSALPEYVPHTTPVLSAQVLGSTLIPTVGEIVLLGAAAAYAYHHGKIWWNGRKAVEELRQRAERLNC